MSEQHSHSLPKSYWRLFTSSTVSNLGDGMVVAAGPLLALQLTNDSRLIAAVTFAAMLPWLVLSLPAGVYLDRHDRQKIMYRANLVRGLVFTLIAVSAANDTLNIYLLIAASAVAGVCELFFDMSSQAILPAIVDEESLELANSRLYISQIISNGFIGLPLGAWIFVIAISAPFAVNAVALVIAAILIRSIKVKNTAIIEQTNAPFSSELKQGLIWLWKHDLLRTLAIMLGVANMCGMFAHAVFVKFVRDELGLGARGFGILLAAISIGSILGGLVGESVSKRLGSTVALITAYVIFGLSDLIPGIFPQIWAVAISGVVMSIAGTIWNVITVSMRQRLIPPELFGRVNSVYRFIGTGTTAIGALIGGQIAYNFGLRATYLASGVLLLIALVALSPAFFRAAKIYIEPERTPAPPSIT
ncbi:MAG: MFS transporter [Ilumatobacteraceae bacterium]|jgi:MFS family permease|nr:MFS transporter [Ilumatobacteraceae bacterium]